MSVKSPLPELTAIVFVLDDDVSAREALESLLRAVGLKVETFASAQGFFWLARG
jgi:FixJ family two-component response regulator